MSRMNSMFELASQEEIDKLCASGVRQWIELISFFSIDFLSFGLLVCMKG